MKTMRFIITSIILLLDVLGIPLLINLLVLLKSNGVEGFSLWSNNINILHSMKLVYIQHVFLNIFLSLQLLIGFLIFKIYFPDRFSSKGTRVDAMGRPVASGNGQFGNGRLMTEREAGRAFKKWDLKEPLEKGGIIVASTVSRSIEYKQLTESQLDSLNDHSQIPKNKIRTVYLEGTDTHILVIGITRSGKGRKILMPSFKPIREAGESVIMTDPKGELYETSSNYFKEYGYNIVLIDLRNPQRGNRWNPVKQVIDAYEKGDISLTVERARDIASTLVNQRGGSSDPIWSDGAESCIMGLILACVMEADDINEKHLTGYGE